MFFVYRFLNNKNEIIYVGRTVNIINRMECHFGGSGHLPIECYEETTSVEFITIPTKIDMNIKELYYINKFKPKYNQKDKQEEPLTISFRSRDSWKVFVFGNNKYTKKLKSEIKNIDNQNETNKLVEKINKNKVLIDELSKKIDEFTHNTYIMQKEIEQIEEEQQQTKQKIYSMTQEEASLFDFGKEYLKSPEFDFVVSGPVKKAIVLNYEEIQYLYEKNYSFECICPIYTNGKEKFKVLVYKLDNEIYCLDLLTGRKTVLSNIEHQFTRNKDLVDFDLYLTVMVLNSFQLENNKKINEIKSELEFIRHKQNRYGNTNNIIRNFFTKIFNRI